MNICEDMWPWSPNGQMWYKIHLLLVPGTPQDFIYFLLWRLKFQGFCYVDKARPVGYMLVCVAFEAFSTFIEWTVKTRTNTQYIMHYLGDFLFSSPHGSFVSAEHLVALHALTGEPWGKMSCWPCRPVLPCHWKVLKYLWHLNFTCQLVTWERPSMHAWHRSQWALLLHTTTYE